MAKEFKSKVIDHYTLILDSEDGTPAKEWKLCYDYGAIARIEDALGIDIKRVDNWPIPTGKFPQVVWGGLRRFNPEVTLEEVQNVLNPDAHWVLYNEIYFLMFPGIREAVEKAEREKAMGATADPNVESATTK